MAIPRLIHQTARSFNELPDEIKSNFSKIKDLNPGWEWRFYDDNEVVDYIRRNLGKTYDHLYERLNKGYGVVMADIFRYLVIFNEGGVYLDAKSTMTWPLDRVLHPDVSYVLSQWADNGPGEPFAGWGCTPDLHRIPKGELQQWHVIAEPGHPFLREVLRQVEFNIEHYHPRWFGIGELAVHRLTGPICYTLAIAPMLPFHPCHLVDIRSLGFFYSIYEHALQHRRDAGNAHYSQGTLPILADRSTRSESRETRWFSAKQGVQ